MNTNFNEIVAENIAYTFLESGKKHIVFACIGTDKHIGDALGPIVGTKLKDYNSNLNVYGTLKDPMHAITIEENIKAINENHDDAFVIGIDACLGDSEDIGEIRFRDYAIKPGKGVGKDLPPVGDVSIIGIVGESEFFFMRSTRLYFIMNIAEEIVNTITHAIDQINLIKDTNSKVS